MRKNKKLHITLCVLVGFLINLFLNIVKMIAMSMVSFAVYESGRSEITDLIFNLLMSDTVFWGTMVIALICGTVPGMLTALLIGVSYLLIGDAFYYFAVNIIIAIVCVFVRNKRFLEKKRNLPLIALILSLIGYFNSFSLEYIPALFVNVLLLLPVLFICRKMIHRFKRIFPIKEAAFEKTYRDHSIKRDILLLINILSVCLSGVFVVFGAIKYHDNYIEQTSQYAAIIGNIIRKDCTAEIIAAGAEKSLEKFNDTELSNILSSVPSYDLYISKIKFYVTEHPDEAPQCIGYIEYEYSLYANNEISDKKIYTTPCDETYSLNANENIFECGDDDGVFFKLIVESRNDYYSSMLNYIFMLVFISVAIIIFVNSFTNRLMDKHIIIPIKNMTSAAAEFAYDTDEHRAESMEKFTALNIKSGDEVEALYDSISKTMVDMNGHITNIKEQAKHISNMQYNIILTMADIVESRDENTGGHIRRTAEYVRIIAETLRDNGQYNNILTDEYIKDMIVAAPLHDMGKIHVSDNILNKPGKLDREEFAVMQSHTTAGKEMLENAMRSLGSFSYLNMAVQMAAYHHEKWNGEGYPEGISGENIPLCARIMAVADVFDALVSKRCYKEPMPLEKAYSIIRKDSGTAFDPVVVDAFFDSSPKIEQAMNSFD